MTTAALLAARPNDQLLAGPLGSFEAYAERISRIPVLTREQEVALFSRLQQHNDLTAARDLSFDPTPDGDDEDSYGPALYLPAADADPAESTANEQWDGDVTRRLSEAVGRLDARSQDIVRRRWIAEDKATLHELAAEYKVSAERVRQIEVAAMKRLKQLMGSEAEAVA